MRVDPRSCTLLKGVVGSTAYGLAHEGSDLDYAGVFAVPTAMLFGLDAPDIHKGFNTKNPDTQFYEAVHFCKLALGCNPTVLELMWLQHYNVRTMYGDQLLEIRSAFLSAKAVRSAYFGYAQAQLNKLQNDERFDKRAKNARHFARLLWQGSNLYRTGELTVKLPDPDYFFSIGEAIANGAMILANAEVKGAEKIFNGPSALPEKPDRDTVNDWLTGVRHGLYRHPDSNPG
jgi:predicted nucleotidyltransferase